MRPSPSTDRPVWLVTRAYRGLLALYPAGFRAEYAQEMLELFEARCLEAYQASGSAGIGRWLWKILAGEARSIYKEYLNMTAELFENDREARRVLWLGMLFLAGTWTALYFAAIASTGGLVPGVILVLTNAMLVAHSSLRSERIEAVAGMAAVSNIFLVAALMAAGSGLASLPAAAYTLQIALTGLHGLLLWRLRGEDLTPEPMEVQKGDQK